MFDADRKTPEVLGAALDSVSTAAPDSSGYDHGKGSWQGSSQISLLNCRIGLVSYTILTLTCRRVFHNPEAEFLLATQVPSQLYDRSTFIFLTALALDLLNVFFERNTVKLELVLLPAFIKVGGLQIKCPLLSCCGSSTTFWHQRLMGEKQNTPPL